MVRSVFADWSPSRNNLVQEEVQKTCYTTQLTNEVQIDELQIASKSHVTTRINFLANMLIGLNTKDELVPVFVEIGEWIQIVDNPRKLVHNNLHPSEETGFPAIQSRAGNWPWSTIVIWNKMETLGNKDWVVWFFEEYKVFKSEEQFNSAVIPINTNRFFYDNLACFSFLIKSMFLKNSSRIQHTDNAPRHKIDRRVQIQ